MKINSSYVSKEAIEETSNLLARIRDLKEQKAALERPLENFLDSFVTDHRVELERIANLRKIRHYSHDIFKSLGVDIKDRVTKDGLEEIFSHPNFPEIADQEPFTFWSDNPVRDAQAYLKLKRRYNQGLTQLGFQRKRIVDEFGEFFYHGEHLESLQLFEEENSNVIRFSSKDDQTNRELYLKINNEEQKVYSPVILDSLGNKYKSIYWSPSGAPFCFGWENPTFAKKGKWTLVDVYNLNGNYRRRTGPFSKIQLVQFDIRKTPEFPRGIKANSYDLSFFNCDWAGEDSTYKASDLALKVGGILMTQRKNITKVNEVTPEKYSLLFDPETEFPPYVLLRKQK